MDQLIFTKIPAIMADVEAIGKNRRNQSQGYAFRGIDDMYNDLHTHFATHKVFYTSEVLSTHREEKTTKNGSTMQYVVLNVKFTFYAIDGSSVSSVMVGEASDSGDKASNKAMSTALKYALMQLLLIPTEEDKDTENHSPEFKSEKPQTTPAPKSKSATKISKPAKETPAKDELLPGTPRWDKVVTDLKSGAANLDKVKNFFILSEANEKTLAEIK